MKRVKIKNKFKHLSDEEIQELFKKGYKIIKTELIGLIIYVYWE